MTQSYRKLKVKEGKAGFHILRIDNTIEGGETTSLPKDPVFYNPIMVLNRDTAVTVLSVYSDEISRPIKVCDPFCGSGIRGIRFSSEIPIEKKVIMGDLNPKAVKLSEENIRLNNVSDEVKVRLLDANLLLNIHSHPFARFDYIDVDPYGTPVYYLDSSIRASHNGSILAVTATDLAPLCGVNPLACKRKYGGIPLRVDYCHEVALRLVIGSIARTAAVHEFGIEPVFGFYADHYVRVYVRLRRGARNADDSIRMLGLIYHCSRCGERRVVNDSIDDSNLCECCGNRVLKGGPMWVGEYANVGFCDKMLSIVEKSGFLNKGTIRVVNLVKNEVGLPATFYNIDKLSGSIGRASIPTRELFEMVMESGYNVVRTHFDPRGFKTEAPLSEIRKLLKD